MRRDTWQALRSRVVFVNAPLERSESDSSARIGVSILRKISIGTVQIFQYRYLSKYRYFWQHYFTPLETTNMALSHYTLFPWQLSSKRPGKLLFVPQLYRYPSLWRKLFRAVMCGKASWGLWMRGCLSRGLKSSSINNDHSNLMLFCFTDPYITFVRKRKGL